MSVNLNGHEKPVNKIAAFSSAKGYEFSIRYDKQPEINKATKTIPFQGPKEFDLTGYKYSRMTVIGMIEGRKRKWKVKCSCGNYVLRRAEKIRQADPNIIHACGECLAFLKAKSMYYKHKTGKYKYPYELQ